MNPPFIPLIPLIVTTLIVLLAPASSVFIAKIIVQNTEEVSVDVEKTEGKDVAKNEEAKKNEASKIQKTEEIEKRMHITETSALPKTVVPDEISTEGDEPSSNPEVFDMHIVAPVESKEVPSPPPQQVTIPCSDTTVKPEFTADITDFSKIKTITTPSIKGIGGPKGFAYVSTNRSRVPVYAPTGMTLESGIYKKDAVESPPYYMLYFTIHENCNYHVMYTYIDELAPTITQGIESTPTVGESTPAKVRTIISLEAGDLIGFAKGSPETGRWGFGMYHTKEKGILATTENFYDPYGYSVCWTDFYVPPLKKQSYRNLLEGPLVVCFF